ncbi:MAG: FG-GAP-like repeat-containing protein [Anaerolineae bacterium]|nr:FG-GAP-like repeat-containing protein [Thermoflexales bacterium]MDW8395118.1 FG-GAP-like repeat-containing protein [Anaerolineae bacterium]
MSGSFSERGAVQLADLDSNGTLEIIVGGRTLNGPTSLGCQGRVYVYNHNGTLKWETTVRADVNGSAAIADLTNDGVLDIVFGMGNWIDTYPANDCDGGLVALDGANGAVLWYFDTADFGEEGAPNGRLDGVNSAPAIADLDNDGVLDIVFAAWDHCIYRINQYGQALWGRLPALPSYHPAPRCNDRGFWVQDTIWGSPALADLDADGTLEIVIGTDITAGGYFGYGNGGVLWVLSASGSILARRFYDQAFFSSPVVADLDGDGLPEIAIGTGPYWPNTGSYVVFARYDPSQPSETLRLVETWRPATNGKGFASPALGDLNGDGFLDMVITTFSQGSFIYPTPMYVYGFDYKNRQVLFVQILCNASGASNLMVFGSPLVANVVGPASSPPEIIFGYQPNVVILNANGSYYTQVPPSCNWSQPPTTNLIMSTGHMFGTPAVGDIDNDGDVEIVATGIGAGFQGRMFAWSGFAKNPNPWPRFRRDIRQTALRDNMPPAPPGLSANPLPNPAGWYAPQTFSITFNPLSIDYGSRLRGYSIVWDQSPTTTPDLTTELPRTATGTTQWLNDGQWYFHVRAVDNQNNGSVVARVGPFRVDATPPTNPTLSSSSPAVNTWSNANAIQVNLNPGTDAGSGIQGYSVVWDSSPNTLPDTTLDIGPVTSLSLDTTSQTVNQIYLHLRSVDHAGNWSPTATHIGPFLIDRVAPSNPTLSSSSPAVNVWSNTGLIQVNLNLGTDTGSGIFGYSVVWDSSPNTLPDTTLDIGPVTSLSLDTTSQTVNQIYLHLRSVDHAGNWSPTAIHIGPFLIDRVRPTSYASSPPLVTGSSIPVSWAGTDLGAGIAGYTLQVRIGNGSWTDWLVNTTATSGSYSPVVCGQTYAFRSIARDGVNNVETDFSAAGDTLTFAGSAHSLRGVVRNVRGQPVFNAQLTSSGACADTTSDGSGVFRLYYTSGGSYNVAASRNGFGSLDNLFALNTAQTITHLIILPPANNQVTNSFFEGGLMDWIVFNVTHSNAAHSGQGAAQLSAPASLSQTVTVPANGTLSLVYRVTSAGTQPAVLKLVGQSQTLSVTLPVTATEWSHAWLDASTLAGGNAAIVVETSDTGLLVDEVTLGTAAQGVFARYLPLARR